MSSAGFVFQTDQQLDCALDLMRRLPPQQIEKNLSDLIDLVSCSQDKVQAQPGLSKDFILISCIVFVQWKETISAHHCDFLKNNVQNVIWFFI